jgi:hypothetical protein
MARSGRELGRDDHRGWACDHEWPGATIGVRVLRRRAMSATSTGSTLLAWVRADQGWAGRPWRARSPGRVTVPARYTRHGFSYTLP